MSLFEQINRDINNKTQQLAHWCSQSLPLFIQMVFHLVRHYVKMNRIPNALCPSVSSPVYVCLLQKEMSSRDNVLETSVSQCEMMRL